MGQPGHNLGCSFVFKMAKTKLTPKLHKEIIKIIADGQTYKTAFEYAGINETTFYDWLKRGEKEKNSIFVKFLMAVKKADNDAKMVLVNRIKAAGQDFKHWTANAWLLERRWRDEFSAPKVAFEHSGQMAIIVKNKMPKPSAIVDISKKELTGVTASNN